MILELLGRQSGYIYVWSVATGQEKCCHKDGFHSRRDIVPGELVPQEDFCDWKECRLRHIIVSPQEGALPQEECRPTSFATITLKGNTVAQDDCVGDVYII